MRFVEVRNEIVYRLEQHIGCPVILSEQIADQPEYPYCYYSVLASRISRHAFGLRELTADGETLIAQRSEPVEGTMSFTFCGMNREMEDGGYIFGEDEALALTEKAHGFFLLNAHNIPTGAGDIVINNVGPVAKRSGFLVEETIRRYGFDVRFDFVRVDEMRTTNILHANYHGKSHSEEGGKSKWQRM